MFYREEGDSVDFSTTTAADTVSTTVGIESTTGVYETTTLELEATTVEEDDPNFNWRARGVQRRRKKIVTTTQTSGKDSGEGLLINKDVQ